MPRIREIVVDGEIFKTRGAVVARLGGTMNVLTYTLQHGELLYMGHRVEYLRHEAEPEPCAFPKLDAFVQHYKPVKARPKPNRWPILSRRHVTMHLGVFR